MSSTLKDLPWLNGTNYKCWATNMESYLWSQGLWSILTRSQPDHNCDPQGNITVDKTDAINLWKDNNNKALGAVCLNMEPHIASRFTLQNYTLLLWQEIKDAYSEFKMMLDTAILANNHLATTFAKLNVHFVSLDKFSYTVAENIQIMLTSSKIPSYANIFLQFLN